MFSVTVPIERTLFHLPDSSDAAEKGVARLHSDVRKDSLEDIPADDVIEHRFELGKVWPDTRLIGLIQESTWHDFVAKVNNEFKRNAAEVEKSTGGDLKWYCMSFLLLTGGASFFGLVEGARDFPLVWVGLGALILATFCCLGLVFRAQSVERREEIKTDAALAGICSEFNYTSHSVKVNFERKVYCKPVGVGRFDRGVTYYLKVDATPAAGGVEMS